MKKIDVLMSKIAVILVDDHEVVRQGLRALLESQVDMQVVGEAQNGHQAISLALEKHPDVVVMDISMPGLNGLEATREIVKSVPDAKVLVLTSYDDDDCVVQMSQAGAVGYLTKRSAADELTEAIRAVRRGRDFYSPEIAKRLRERGRTGSEEQTPTKSSELTKREEQVLQLVADGYPNKGIASQLGISVKTVEKHRQAVMNKLNIHETAGLTRFALSKRSRPLASPAPPETQSKVPGQENVDADADK
jgi:DNA-binding NarL/FixJ family response regulator